MAGARGSPLPAKAWAPATCRRAGLTDTPTPRSSSRPPASATVLTIAAMSPRGRDQRQDPDPERRPDDVRHRRPEPGRRAHGRPEEDVVRARQSLCSRSRGDEGRAPLVHDRTLEAERPAGLCTILPLSRRSLPDPRLEPRHAGIRDLPQWGASLTTEECSAGERRSVHGRGSAPRAGARRDDTREPEDVRRRGPEH